MTTPAMWVGGIPPTKVSPFKYSWYMRMSSMYDLSCSMSRKGSTARNINPVATPSTIVLRNHDRRLGGGPGGATARMASSAGASNTAVYFEAMARAQKTPTSTAGLRWYASSAAATPNSEAQRSSLIYHEPWWNNGIVRRISPAARACVRL